MTLGKQDIKTAISEAKDVSSLSPFSKVIKVFTLNTIHEFASRNWMNCLQRIERYLSKIQTVIKKFTSKEAFKFLDVFSHGEEFLCV